MTEVDRRRGSIREVPAQLDGAEAAIARLYDAHNHLQDERLAGRQTALVRACREQGVRRMVVNGACESDWPEVARMAHEYPEVLPSFGYHPWHTGERSALWEARLEAMLDQVPSAVGEIGLDRWKPGLDYAGQEEVFAAQMRLAARRNLPASIHCLRAWGALTEHLRRGPRPERGFVLHSYGGPVEMIPPLVRLGAYFSFPGYFLHPRKARQREAFKHVPADRLLVETDAPDQCPPKPEAGFGIFHPLDPGPDGRPINHPANLGLVYAGLAQLLGMRFENLAAQVERNFLRVFGGF